MKTRLIHSIIILLSTYSVFIAQDKKNLEVLNGFKKFKYGQPYSIYKNDGFKSNDMTCPGKPQVKCYSLDSRNNSYYKIASVQFVETSLNFTNEQLFEIIFWTIEDEVTYKIGVNMGFQTETRLLNELTSLFGKPTDTLSETTNMSDSRIYRWETNKYRCDFRFSRNDFGDIVYNYEIKFTNLLAKNKADLDKYTK